MVRWRRAIDPRMWQSYTDPQMPVPPLQATAATWHFSAATAVGIEVRS
jgi:hypothetical protein